MTLHDIAARLETAEAGSPELDADIHETVSGFPARLGGVGWPEGELVVPSLPGWERLPTYTASVDAVLALIARVLPEKAPILRVPATREACAAFTDHGWFISDRSQAFFAPTPALALCKALVQALKANAPEEPQE